MSSVCYSAATSKRGRRASGCCGCLLGRPTVGLWVLLAAGGSASEQQMPRYNVTQEQAFSSGKAPFNLKEDRRHFDCKNFHLALRILLKTYLTRLYSSFYWSNQTLERNVWEG